MADSMNKPAIQLKTLQWLKRFIPPGQDAFSLLASQLERGSEQENLWTLNKLESLGKAAAEDLRCLKIRSEESDEIGLTGALVNSHKGKNVQYGYDDLFGFHEDPLPEDDSLKKFRALLRECQSLVNVLDPEKMLTHSTEKLRQVLEKEDELMILMRRHKALCSTGLDLPASDEENLHRELHALFGKTFKLIGFLNDDCEKEKLQKQMMTCAWVWEKGPPQCVLISNNSALENLSVRIYGVESVDCAAAKVQVKQDDAESSHKQEIKIMKSSDKARSGAGILLELSKIFIRNIQGTRKNQKNVRLYRVTCEIPVSMPGSVAFICSSLPFTVRSGSTQLWAYTSSIIWFIWAQTDVRKPDSECPKKLEMDSVLTLIQARIIGADLRLDNKALMEKVNVGTCSSSWPLHKLTDGERKGWADAVRDNCGSDRTRNPEMITRDNFIKHLDNKLFIWQIVTAAVNTGIRLKKYNLDRFFHIGLSNNMCRTFPEMKIGDFILRSSLNRIDPVAGLCPYAAVVIQVQTEKEAEPVVKNVDEFDGWNLKEIVENVIISSHNIFLNNPCTILPSKQDVKMIDDIIRGKENNTTKYKPYKGSKQEQNPPTVNLSETFESMENLSLHSSQIQSLDLFNAQQNDTPASSPITEREEEGPQTKKFAAQEDMLFPQKSMQSFSGPATGMTCQLSAGPPGLADTESLGLDSLEESPPSSLPGARTPEIRDDVRIMTQQDEDYIMKDITPAVLNDVLLSSGSGSGEPYIQVGQIPNMSPASMVSEDVWSPASENFLNGNGVGISETGFLPPPGL